VLCVLFLICGYLTGYLGVLVLVPFLPAMCASPAAIVVATGRILREIP